MARYRTTIESSLPPDVAFAELADFSSAERWDPGVISARRVDNGELGLGSRFHLEVTLLLDATCHWTTRSWTSSTTDTWCYAQRTTGSSASTRSPSRPAQMTALVSPTTPTCSSTGHGDSSTQSLDHVPPDRRQGSRRTTTSPATGPRQLSVTHLADLVDSALETTVVLSFTKLGPRVRSRLFDWISTDELPRLDRQVVLVTGATSGLGEAAATSLARLGASVRLLARNPEKATATVQRIRSATANDDVQAGIADLANLDDVRRFAERFLHEHNRLDVIVHSAGALVHDYQRTTDGIELTAQTHVVAPYLLTCQLMPLLEATTRFSRSCW